MKYTNNKMLRYFNTTFNQTRKVKKLENISKTRMWADVQRDGCPTEYRWRPLFNAAKFG